MSAVTASGRYRDAFAVAEFRAIFVAHVVSMVGNVAAQLALTVLVYARTGSALLSALTFATGFVPYLIAGTFLSALVDRIPARRLMTWCSGLSAVVAAAMALPAPPVAVLLVLAFVLGLIQPVFLGARSATLRDVLPEAAYVPGRSLIRLVSQGAQMGGFAVSGLLLTFLTPRALLLGNAASFAVAALLLRVYTVRRPVPPERSTAPSLLADSLGGIRAVFAIPALRRLLLFMWAVVTLGVVPEALMVPYAAGKSADTVAVGLLLTAIPLGTFLAEMVTTWTVSAARQMRTVGLAVTVAFAPLLLFGVRPSVPTALLFLFVAGFGGASQLGLDRLMVAVAPEPLLARALAVQSAGVMFWQGVGFAAAGGAAEVLPASVVIVAAALLGLAAVAAYTLADRRAHREGAAAATAAGPTVTAEPAAAVPAGRT